ncbi:MAG: hypothetical protein PVI26_05595, partial [Chitinispirillia bacterium]
MIFNKIVVVIFYSLLFFSFKVIGSDNSINTKPEIVSTYSENAKVNVGYTYYLKARDRDNDSLIFEPQELPGWLRLVDSCNGNALLYGIPDYS